MSISPLDSEKKHRMDDTEELSSDRINIDVNPHDNCHRLKKTVFAFYHVNSHKYIIDDIVKLSIHYLWMGDEFKTDAIPAAANISISGGGINNICTCISDTNESASTVFGIKTVSFSNIKEHNYYRWQFKILPEDTRESMMFAVGIVDTMNTQNILQFGGGSFYHPYQFKKNDILDMYLDLNEHDVTFMTNNNHCLSRQRIFEGYAYTMMISLSGKQSIELISFDHSEDYDINKNKDIYNIVGFGNCISDGDEKKRLINNALKMHPDLNEAQNDYIGCLVSQRKIVQAYDYIITNNIKCIRHAHNIAVIGNYFYDNYENDNYQDTYGWNITPNMQAAKMYLLITDDDVLIEQELCFKIADCYMKIKKEPRLALKYFDMFLKYQKNVTQENTILCLVNMAEIYTDLMQYRNALDCYLKLHENTIRSKNLEQQISLCYEMEKDYNNALLWRQKNRDDSIYDGKIAYLLEMMNDVEKAEEYYNNVLNSDEGKTDFDVHYDYAKFLQRSKKQYEKSVMYYNKTLDMYPITYGQKEKCHIELGMLFYKLGDFDKAVKHSKSALFFDSDGVITLNNLGYFYLMTNQYKLSYKYLIKSIEIDEDNYLTNGYLGNCLCGMEKYDEAIIYLAKALTKQNDWDNSNILLMCLEKYSNILFMQNNYAESIKMCKQLTEMDEFVKYGNKEKIYYLMSVSYVNIGNLDEALVNGLKAAKIKPNAQQYVKNVNNIKYKMSI